MADETPLDLASSLEIFQVGQTWSLVTIFLVWTVQINGTTGPPKKVIGISICSKLKLIRIIWSICWHRSIDSCLHLGWFFAKQVTSFPRSKTVFGPLPSKTGSNSRHETCLKLSIRENSSGPMSGGPSLPWETTPKSHQVCRCWFSNLHFMHFQIPYKTGIFHGGLFFFAMYSSWHWRCPLVATSAILSGERLWTWGSKPSKLTFQRVKSVMSKDEQRGYHALANQEMS